MNPFRKPFVAALWVVVSSPAETLDVPLLSPVEPVVVVPVVELDEPPVALDPLPVDEPDVLAPVPLLVDEPEPLDPAVVDALVPVLETVRGASKKALTMAVTS